MHFFNEDNKFEYIDYHFKANLLNIFNKCIFLMKIINLNIPELWKKNKHIFSY